MIFLILIISLFLRLISLDQSLWLDEAVTANVVRSYDFWGIIKTFSPTDFHPPLYYLFLDLWGKIVGTGVINLRLPSVIFSLITIWVVYLIGKEIKNKNAGLVAAILVALNPLFMYYSQEARMYAMAVMFLTIVLFNFIRIIKSKNPRLINVVAMNAAGFLAFSSFYGSIFLLASLGIYLLLKRKIKLFFVTNIGLLLAIILFLPLIQIQLNNSKILLTQVANWKLVLGQANLKNLLLIPLKFSVGKISFYPKILYYVVGGIWTGIVLLMMKKGVLKFPKNHNF